MTVTRDSRTPNYVVDGDGHVIEPGGIFGSAQRADRNPINVSPNTPFEMCGGADLSEQFESGWSAESYLHAMDAQGIDAAVLYPSVGLFVPYQDGITTDEHLSACAGYDDWIAQYCAHAPNRLAGVGIAPVLGEGAVAAREAERAKGLGLVAMMVRPNFVFGRNLGDRGFDPLYDALEANGLVLAVHEGFGVQSGPTIGADRFPGFTARHLCSHPMEQMAAMASLMLDGALERHPQLRVAFLESGTGWLPYWLARLDDHIEWMHDTETKQLSLSATEYFARQCVISCDPEDTLVARTVETVGADHVIWASDFPHPDAAYPDAVEEFLEENPTLDRPTLESVLSRTPAEFYDLTDRFTPRAS
ncbi:MAG TPA: amidohydrolase family protein [Acidimicrobiia bacterium]